MEKNYKKLILAAAGFCCVFLYSNAEAVSLNRSAKVEIVDALHVGYSTDFTDAKVQGGIATSHSEFILSSTSEDYVQVSVTDSNEFEPIKVVDRGILHVPASSELKLRSEFALPNNWQEQNRSKAVTLAVSYE